LQILSRSEWDAYLGDHPDAHLLQTGAWGDLKAAFGWEPVRLVEGKCGAQVLFRKLPLGLTSAYLPKGPVGDDWSQLWPELDRLCRKKRAVFLKIEPDLWEPLSSARQADLAGFRPNGVPVQPRRTLIVDLHGSEEDWLARMSKKTRACFRTAEKGGVTVRESRDVEAFYGLLEETGQRDEFGVHSLSYYRNVFSQFITQNAVELLLAEWESHLLAGLMVFRRGRRAWYLYAASRGEQRQLNPTYLLQLEAMRWAAHHGCREYDLYGVPDFDEETLEAQFTERQDGLWGVYGYKRKFGGHLMRTVGAWERVYFPPLHAVYRWWAARRGSGGEG
jgi:lipid II:glycine glycyltransferase (peptidoglycan interpeptide bridge formation enzyme)